MTKIHIKLNIFIFHVWVYYFFLNFEPQFVLKNKRKLSEHELNTS